jgi:rod shape-determining protein MreC
MLSDRSARRRLLTFGLLVALSVAMLVVSGSAPVQELRRGVHFAVAPMQDTLSDGTRSVTEVLGAFSRIDTLRRENDELRATVERLQDQIGSFETVEEENRRLTKLLKIKQTNEHETVAAEVTAYYTTGSERMITLDRGTEAGIKARFPVLSEGGALAGRVTEAGNGWAEVMLISDSRTVVAGLDRRTRATGDITGRLDAPLRMTNIKRTETVAESDRIVTLGANVGKQFRSVFPKGLLIGTVIDVQEEPGEVVKTALISPAADLEHLERVLVITDHKLPKLKGDDPPEDAEAS